MRRLILNRLLASRTLLFAVLVLTAIAYTTSPGSGAAPFIKPVPALVAAALIRQGTWGGRDAVAAGLLIAAVGDVMVDFGATLQVGTLAFAISVVVMAVGLRRSASGPWWHGLLLAGLWAGVSGYLVVPDLGQRRTAGLVVLAATFLFLFVAGRTTAIVAAGATLIATNFTLFAIDLVVTPMPRWLVIATYYLGLLVLAVGMTGRRRGGGRSGRRRRR